MADGYFTDLVSPFNAGANVSENMLRREQIRRQIANQIAAQQLNEKQFQLQTIDVMNRVGIARAKEQREEQQRAAMKIAGLGYQHDTEVLKMDPQAALIKNFANVAAMDPSNLDDLGQWVGNAAKANFKGGIEMSEYTDPSGQKVQVPLVKTSLGNFAQLRPPRAGAGGPVAQQNADALVAAEHKLQAARAANDPQAIADAQLTLKRLEQTTGTVAPGVQMVDIPQPDGTTVSTPFVSDTKGKLVPYRPPPSNLDPTEKRARALAAAEQAVRNAEPGPAREVAQRYLELLRGTTGQVPFKAGVEQLPVTGPDGKPVLNPDGTPQTVSVLHSAPNRVQQLRLDANATMTPQQKNAAGLYAAHKAVIDAETPEAGAEALLKLELLEKATGQKAFVPTLETVRNPETGAEETVLRTSPTQVQRITKEVQPEIVMVDDGQGGKVPAQRTGPNSWKYDNGETVVTETFNAQTGEMTRTVVRNRKGKGPVDPNALTTSTKGVLEKRILGMEDTLALGAHLDELITEETVGVKGAYNRIVGDIQSQAHAIFPTIFPKVPEDSKATDAEKTMASMVNYQANLINSMRQGDQVSQNERAKWETATPTIEPWKGVNAAKARLKEMQRNMVESLRRSAPQLNRPIPFAARYPKELLEMLASGEIAPEQFIHYLRSSPYPDAKVIGKRVWDDPHLRAIIDGKIKPAVAGSPTQPTVVPAGTMLPPSTMTPGGPVPILPAEEEEIPGFPSAETGPEPQPGYGPPARTIPPSTYRPPSRYEDDPFNVSLPVGTVIPIPP
jgi:hypothetical protein